MSNKHTFAIFYGNLNPKTKTVILDEKDIVNRITNILKLNPNEKIDLFKRAIKLECIIKKIEKNRVELDVLNSERFENTKPEINLYIGLTKKETFEEIIYNATEIGASTINPVITEKIHKNWWDAKYIDRFNKIIIAAAEQSKNFLYPELLSPIKFDDLIKNSKSLTNKILLDPSGENCIDYLKNLTPGDINLIIGPEGDFSIKEKDSLIETQFKKCKLTQNILRSVQAVNVALGIFKST